MRDDFIKKNIIVVIVGLLLFFFVSIMSTSSISKKSLEQQLVNVSKVINTQVDNVNTEEELFSLVDSYTSDQNWLRIIIADSNGLILKDSTDDSVGSPYHTNLSIEEIDKINDKLNNEFIYTLEEELCYLTRITDDLIVRTSVIMDNNTELILTNFFYLLLLLLIVIMISLVLTKKTTDNIINTFDTISTHLKTINDGKYIEINSKHKYPEVSEVLEEINDINTNIYNSMLKTKNEHDKTNFIINNMQQGILIVNTKDEILIINDYAKEALNINVKKAYYKKYREIILNELLLEKIKLALELKNNYFFDIENVEKEKIYFSSITHLSRKWSDIEKNEDLIVCLLTDVTEERANDKVKAEFISNASHELKTPITSIRGFAELLLVNEEKNDPKTNKYLNIIYNEAIKMKDTIDELLYLSNLEYKRTNVDALELINIKDLIFDIINSYKDLADKSEITFITDIEDIDIFEQEKLLKHLISNIIENAIKYNKFKGQVIIKVKEDDNNIILTIEDTGIGIDEKYKEKIFERFFRVDESHNKNTGGSGIGLNIVKQICATINAKINVESKINVGTKFTILLNKNK